MDEFLLKFIQNAIQHERPISNEILENAKEYLKNKEFIQETFEDGSKIIACSDRVKLTIQADDDVEKLDCEERPEYFKWVRDNCEEYLISKNVVCNDFSTLCWKKVADAEYHISLFSLNPFQTSPEDFIFHRARTWAHVMLFYMHDFLHIFITPELIESTALRGLALAIMDDAEDAKEDLEKNEHTVFSVYPEKAVSICSSILNQIEKFHEKPPYIFQFFESLMGQSVLNVLLSAAALRVKQFSDKVEEEGIFSVRKYLKSLAE